MSRHYHMRNTQKSTRSVVHTNSGKHSGLVKPKPNEPIKLTLDYDEHLFNAFPNKDAPLKKDITPLLEQQAYIILYNREEKVTQNRVILLHSSCPGAVDDRQTESDVKAFLETHTILVVDLSQYPVLMNESEWSHTIKRITPSYKNCNCRLSRLLPSSQAQIQRTYYRLESPYYYLCGLNDEVGEKDCAGVEESFKNTKLLSYVQKLFDLK